MNIVTNLVLFQVQHLHNFAQFLLSLRITIVAITIDFLIDLMIRQFFFFPFFRKKDNPHKIQ